MGEGRGSGTFTKNILTAPKSKGKKELCHLDKLYIMQHFLTGKIVHPVYQCGKNNYAPPTKSQMVCPLLLGILKARYLLPLG